jgi:glutathione synthase/RimK-type ligase-like ATP-grasp enzyme
MKKETVGILLDDSTFAQLPSRHTGNEQLHLYNRAASQLKLAPPLFMNLRRIKGTSANGYTYSGQRYRLQHRSLPRVVHNRDLALRPGMNAKLTRLSRSSVVFNRKNRYSKTKIAAILAKNKALRPYLPDTYTYSPARLTQTMSRYNALFIKPASGSVGDGIMKLSRTGKDQWLVQWKKQHKLSGSKARALVHRATGGKPYLIQEAVMLALYRGRPYDIRVSVQKGQSGAWQITGMVGKVAAPGRHVTNVAKGGSVKQVRTLFRHSGLPPEETAKAVARVSLQIAACLDRHLPRLADLGLDMGVDRNGRVKFIEMNGRDQRYSFRKAGMNAEFFRTYRTPMEYAKRLLARSHAKNGKL